MVRLGRFAGLVVGCCSFTVALSVHGQSDQKITMTMPASSAAAALQQLGAAAHVQLLTSPQTAKDVVSFQFKAVPLSEAMARIADAVDGSWKREGKSFRLIRTANQQKAEVQKEFDETVASIRNSIQEQADALKKMHPWSEGEADALATEVQSLLKDFNPKGDYGGWYRKGTQLSTQTPIGRALTKVCTSLNPSELASLPQRMKAVWSSNPTPTERPLSSEIAQITDEFAKAQSDWAGAIDKHQLKAPTEGKATYYVGGLGLFKDNFGGNVSLILLSVTPQGPSNGFYCELSAFDEKGTRIAQATTSLSRRSEGNLTLPAIPSPLGDVKITLGADAQLLIANHDKSPRRAKKQAAGLIEKLMRPDQFDPLSIFFSPKLIQAANILKVNMVAHLTDNMFSPDIFIGPKDISVDDFLHKDAGNGATVELKDGWLTVKPKRPSEWRSLQADRIALGSYLRKVSTGRPLSLDDQAAFALSLPDSADNLMPESLSGFLRTQTYDDYDRNMLLLFGLLTSEQKSKMANGGLPFGALGAKELECVNRMIYAQNSLVWPELPKGQTEQQRQALADLFDNGRMHETTECLPNGIPPQGLITLTVANSNVTFTPFADSESDDNGTWGYARDARSIAFLKYSQGRPDLFKWVKDGSYTFDLRRIMYGRQVKMAFKFQFTPILSMAQELGDTNISDFQTMTLDDLPEDFKKQIQVAYDKYAMDYANAKPGHANGGGSIPPP